MQSRNYRIIRFITAQGESYRLLPVAYNSEGYPIGLLADRVDLLQDTVTLLLHDITHMMAAFSLPVLDYSLFDNPDIERATQQALELLENKNV
jgi:hypothetical protein